MISIKRNADTLRKKHKTDANALGVPFSKAFRILIPKIVEELALRSAIGDDNDPSYNYPNKPEQGNRAGWYVSNWQVTFDAPANTPRSNAGASQGVGHSIDEAFAMMQSFTVKGSPNVFITNPVPYAALLEYTDHAKDSSQRGVLQQVTDRIPILTQDALLEAALAQ